ncbi:MAG: DUF3467 domain-containing protein [Bacteroidales bacterium]|nr:DUF3467 domain-containing protein [Bacteroidales bacterium]
MDNNEKGKIAIELTPNTLEAYSNMAVIAHSKSEFVIDFISLLPGTPKAPVKARIILTPEHAKNLLVALQQNIQRYEEQFGNIDNNNTTPTPIMFGNGEA